MCDAACAMQWLRDTHLLPAAADMDALLRDPELQNSAKSLQHCAVKIGIAVPNETATKMLERWLYSERAHRLLKANGRNSLDKKLRTHAPAGSTRTEPVPQPQGLSAPGTRAGVPMECAGTGAQAVEVSPFKPLTAEELPAVEELPVAGGKRK